MKFKMTLAVAALLTIGLSSAAAYADTVAFTLTNPVQPVLVSTGGTLTFDATVFAPITNTGDVFLNGVSINATNPLIWNDNDFFNNFPFFLTPGESFTGDIFTITAPSGIPFGTYLGSVTLQGGSDGNAEGTLGTKSFSDNAVTYPSSIMLLLTGMAGLARFNGKLRNWVR